MEVSSYHSLSFRVSPVTTWYHPEPALLGSGAHPLLATAVAARARTESVMKECIFVGDYRVCVLRVSV